MIGGLIAAWLDVRSKPLRTIAAIGGMVAAVVAVVLVDAAGTISQDASDEYLARRFGLPITVSIATVSDRPAIDDEQWLEEVLTSNGIMTISPRATVPILVLANGSLRNDTLTLVSSSYSSIRVVEVIAGAWPFDTARFDVGHVVVSESKAGQLGFASPQLAVGEVIWFATEVTLAPDIRTTEMMPMVIDAVASSTTNAFDEGTGILFVSDLAEPGVGTGGSAWLARVNPQDFGMLQDLLAMTDPATGQRLFEWNRIDQSEELAPLLEQQEVTARAVQVVALTVGGLGVLAVGLASVRERSREFGLRRALGASTGMVFSSVFMQSILEVLLAAVIAVPLAAVLLELFARQLVLEQLPLPAGIGLPMTSVFVGIVAALGVGLIAGVAPALSAARASVAQSLRA